MVDDGRGLVQLLGVREQALEMLERGGVVEAVADALVSVDRVVDDASDDGRGAGDDW